MIWWDNVFVDLEARKHYQTRNQRLKLLLVVDGSRQGCMMWWHHLKHMRLYQPWESLSLLGWWMEEACLPTPWLWWRDWCGSLFFFHVSRVCLDPFVLYLVDVWSGPLLLAFQCMNCNMNFTAVWDTNLWSAWGLAANQWLLSVLLSALFFGAFSGGTYQKSHCTS